MGVSVSSLLLYSSRSYYFQDSFNLFFFPDKFYKILVYAFNLYTVDSYINYYWILQHTIYLYTSNLSKEHLYVDLAKN